MSILSIFEKSFPEKFLLNIYLFIWLHWVFVAALGLLSSCGVWALECMGSVVAACGLSSCGARA